MTTIPLTARTFVCFIAASIQNGFLKVAIDADNYNNACDLRRAEGIQVPEH